ncbi:MAG TPA: cytochrome c oxidase subunit II [Pirellulales bacterium]|jgi:cytochrome c oxidase subunit 2
MDRSFRLFPEQAAEAARRVDHVYFALVAMALVLSILIFSLVIFFAVKYRRTSSAYRGPAVTSNLPLELLWTGAPFLVSLGLFAWGAQIYIDEMRPPTEALDIYVVGKQWMWKMQHPMGNREINELHVPRGTPVKLTMISQDVIHSFYVPAFRIKRDVLPGRYVTIWFEANKTGEYHLFCAEYCGTSHARMGGRVVVMEPADYQRWLAGGSTSLRSQGEELFGRLGCANCHRADSSARAPLLAGAFGRPVALSNGSTVLFDANYTRESILNPRTKIVAGYEPIMPSFTGQVSEEELVQLVEYIKTLGAGDNTGGL